MPEPNKALYFPYFFRLVSFWLLVFATFRLVWLVMSMPQLHDASWGTILLSFIAGFKLDISTIAYIALPSFLLWVIYQFTNSRIVFQINQWYHYVLFFAFSLLYVCTIKMYGMWNALLHVGVFDYLADPGEVVSFITTGELILLVVSIAAWVTGLILLYKKLVRGFTYIPGRLRYKLFISVVLPVVFIVGARGGLQLVPVNESTAYHSDISYFNHLAINPFWYFMHSMLEKDAEENPYLFYDSNVASDRVRHLLPPTDTSFTKVLTTTRPNIVFILLESWTADIIAALDGESNVTPYFDSLRQDGLLFTKIYSAGSRTEHGLISVLSGYPPPPKVSIITIPHKVSQLGSINTLLNAQGYSSSFYYGGEIGFVNMKGYLIQTGFENIVDKENFDEAQLNSKWGAHDEFVFEKQLQDLNQADTPFFSVVLTLSTHEPFEVPMKTPFNGKDEPDKFRKSAYYTDACLRRFFAIAKKQPWYDNTLFVLVADHGHRLPKKRHLDWPQTKRVPLLWYGSVIDSLYRGTTIARYGNQHDLPATLAHQLGLDASVFPLSKNLLDPDCPEYGYYVTDNVMGWVTSKQTVSYNFTKETFRMMRPDPIDSLAKDSIEKDAKAFLQMHFQRYLDY
jgi:phosphoglycerol transferase MdoB-like AlkP superfamily enzyme